MTYPELRDAAMQRLTELGHGHHVRLLRHAQDRQELTSCLREYIFHNDADTTAFLATCIPSPLPSDGRGEGQGEVRVLIL